MIKKIAIRIALAAGIFILIVIANLVIFGIIASKVTEGVPIENRDPDRVALLVIDIQEGTTGSASATEAYMEQSETLITHVNRLAADAVEKEWPIVWVVSEVANPLINLVNSTMAKGSVGASLDKRLDATSDYLLVKRKNDPFTNPDLDRILEEEKIGSLVVVGLDAAHCISSTIEAALNRGYQIIVIEEAVITDDEEVKAEILLQFREMGVEIR
jgi:nicotinamidase/pyrazinamidase